MVICLTFQAFVQQLWSDRSCTRITHSHWPLRFWSVPSRRNMWPMLSIIFSCNSQRWVLYGASSYSKTHGVKPYSTLMRLNNRVWKMHCNMEFTKQVFPKASHPSIRPVKHVRHCAAMTLAQNARSQYSLDAYVKSSKFTNCFTVTVTFGCCCHWVLDATARDSDSNAP